jgi:hypothetical protein
MYLYFFVYFLNCFIFRIQKITFLNQKSVFDVKIKMNSQATIAIFYTVLAGKMTLKYNTLI